VPGTLLAFDISSMPPVSLVNNARLEGTYYEVEEVKLPVGMRYTFL
jgi:hypothetical protein